MDLPIPTTKVGSQKIDINHITVHLPLESTVVSEMPAIDGDHKIYVINFRENRSLLSTMIYVTKSEDEIRAAMLQFGDLKSAGDDKASALLGTSFAELKATYLSSAEQTQVGALIKTAETFALFAFSVFRDDLSFEAISSEVHRSIMVRPFRQESKSYT